MFLVLSIFGAILIVCGLYTVVWGKSKDRTNTTETGKEGSQELPMKDSTKSASDNFYGLEISVPGEVLKKGVPPTTSSWRSFHRTSIINFLVDWGQERFFVHCENLYLPHCLHFHSVFLLSSFPLTLFRVSESIMWIQ